MTPSHSGGYVRKAGKYVHRVILLESIGPGTHPCHWCGRLVDWDAPRNARNSLLVDHLDQDRENNDPSNLVPSCQMCNSSRRQDAGYHAEQVNKGGGDIDGSHDASGLDR